MSRDRLPVIVLAVIGASLLLIVAATRWAVPGDEQAYYLAARRLLDGQPLYDPGATPVTPYAFWYPPVVAQVLAPVVAIVSADLFAVIWTALMLVCLWWLAGRDILTTLALCAFPPVAIEFWFRNVHLILAVLLVLGLRRRAAWFTVGAAIKLAPVLGIAYVALRGRRREAAVAAAVGGIVLAGSIAVSPEAWGQFLDVALRRGPTDVSGMLPIPYVPRLVAAVAVLVLASRVRSSLGEPLLVVAVVMALPTLWFTALSTLVAIVPIARAHRIATSTTAVGPTLPPQRNGAAV